LLNDGLKTYIDATGSKAALNLTFVDQRSVLLHTWIGTDPWNSDHFPISIEYNGISELRKGSKKASRLHKKDMDWTAIMERGKEKITEVEMHNGRNRERNIKEWYENFIQIIKGKLEETTPKKKGNTTSEMEDKGK
jgi:hypothetical protein